MGDRKEMGDRDAHNLNEIQLSVIEKHILIFYDMIATS